MRESTRKVWRATALHSEPCLILRCLFVTPFAFFLVTACSICVFKTQKANEFWWRRVTNLIQFCRSIKHKSLALGEQGDCELINFLARDGD